ncbi:MAG: Tfp pilus assembly protein PilN [uncultured Thiotrichaceae bacterium]|uniref:Tfp pilus assembly protein PilN n=1 Tax=uncultured Thiotrichaceae bacterium TaxID=298394 RepID=A0A6S6S5C8_9GAMM|nr:MAG: Tfp pilus assembly protein PilN [uncultured Thiotrichaceae bacterium]
MSLTKVKNFFSWWGEGLFLGLPGSFRQLFRSERPRLMLQPMGDDRLAVFWRQDGKQKSCGEFDLKQGAFDFQRVVKQCAKSKKYLLELALDKRQALHLQHNFPEAAQDNIKQVVSYQLDRLTPFAATEAYFGASVASRDKVKKEVLADIYVAPKMLVDKIATRFSDLGIPDFDSVSTANGAASLSHGRDVSAGSSTSESWSRIPLYFFLAALVLSLAAPVLYKQRRVDQITTALSDLKRDSAGQLEVRDKLLAAEDALVFLKERRRTSPVALEIVEKLSAEIPMHTWLERLELEGQQVQIRGESRKALTLIDTLEESAHFKRVSFKSPVTRSKNSGKDKFHIQAQVEMNHE